MSTLDNLHSWCRANGISVALCQDSQRSAKDMLDELLTVGNSAAVYSGDMLKIIPYDEVSAAGNGAVYNAPTASGPIADLTDNDFATDKDGKRLPLKFTRKRRTDCDNVVALEIIDRSIDYSHNTISECDQKSVALFGPRKGGTLDATDLGINNPSGSKSLLSIHSAEVAQAIGSILAKRGAAGVNEYEFTLNAEWYFLEAMDLVTITDERLGLNQVAVRLTSVKETSERTYECKADQFIYGLNHPDVKTTATASGTLVSINVDPGLVNTPIIFEPTREMLGTISGSQLWFIVSGSDPNYGGCICYVSVDGGTSYTAIGNIGPGTTGTLTADFAQGSDPDTTHTLSVDLSESNGTIDSESQAIADGFSDPCYIHGLAGSPAVNTYEIVCPTVSTITSLDNYDLDTYIRRAVQGTLSMLHASGSRFGAVDAQTFKVDVPAQWLGITLFFKFPAYNKTGQQQNQLSDCVAYPYTIGGVDAEQLWYINGSGSTPTTTTLAQETGHNTSAYSKYNAANFAANFTGTTWVNNTGTTASVDSTKSDDSINPVTPAHVSRTDVHAYFPANSSIPVYAHITPWFGHAGHVQIGVNCNTTTWVQAAIEDAAARGINGFIIDWYGEGSFEDQVTLKIQSYLASRPANTFKFAICFDKGLKDSTGATLSESVLQSAITYCQSQYFSDSNYIKISSKPVLHFFGVASVLGDTAMAAVKAATTGSSGYWMSQGASLISKSYIDGCYDWAHPYASGVSGPDPYNLAAMDAFASAITAASSKKCFLSAYPGFNGYLTKSVAWSKGKDNPRNNGACMVTTAGHANGNITSQIAAIMLVTWNDWEEGTNIESGVDNDLTVSASISTTNVNFSVSGGTGDESTIDHYEIWATTDVTITNPSFISIDPLASVATGVGTYDLSTAGLVAGTQYKIYVEAVGKPCIHNKMSAGVSYTA
jgi:hypothetical protein